MGIYHFEMTNDDTEEDTTSSGCSFAISPGLPELADEPEDIDSPLSDDVFNVLEFNLSPLIKEELRTTIRNKRFGSGMEELVIDNSPRESGELTPEEEERRRQRRDRNRIAAVKCRGKRRDAARALEQEWQAQEQLHTQLETEVEKLESEKQRLLTMMQAHRPSCIIRTDDALKASSSSQNVDAR